MFPVNCVPLNFAHDVTASLPCYSWVAVPSVNVPVPQPKRGEKLSMLLLVLQVGMRQRLPSDHLFAHRRLYEYGFHNGDLLQVPGRPSLMGILSE